MAILPAGETQSSLVRISNLTPVEIEDHEYRRVRMVEDLFLWAEQVKRTVEDKFQQLYEFYYAVDREYQRTKMGHQSKLVLPISYEIVETKTPQLVMSMFTQQPIYGVNPVSSDDPYKAVMAEHILTWQIRQMKNALLSHTLWVKDSNLYGGAIAQTGWDYKCEAVPRNIKLPPAIDWATMSVIQEHHIVNEKVITADQPILINCDVGEIYPDPTASDIEDCKFIIKRMLVPMVDIIKLGKLGIYKNTDKVASERNRAVVHWASQFAQRRFSTHNFTDPFQYEHSMYEYCEILECWWIDPTDPDLKKYKTVVANRKYILQDIPLGQVYWHNRFPFILLKNVPMTKEFWGISEIAMTLDLQRERNSLRNQRMDNLNAILKAYWLVQRSAGINKEKIKRLAPGDIVMTNDINGIKVERPPSIDDLTFNAEAANQNDIQRAANLNDMITGTPTRSQVRNATTANILTENAKTRWGLTVLLYTEQMQRVGQDFLALDQQFMTTPQVIGIIGEDGKQYPVQVDYSDIPRNPDVFVTLGSEIQTNKELRKQMLLQLDPIITSTPGCQVVQWRKDILKDFGFKNPEKYFEGAFVTPTEVFLSGMGVKKDQIQSSYLDQLSQLRGVQPNQHTDPQLTANTGDMLNNGYNASMGD